MWNLNSSDVWIQFASGDADSWNVLWAGAHPGRWNEDMLLYTDSHTFIRFRYSVAHMLGLSYVIRLTLQTVYFIAVDNVIRIQASLQADLIFLAWLWEFWKVWVSSNPKLTDRTETKLFCNKDNKDVIEKRGLGQTEEEWHSVDVGHVRQRCVRSKEGTNGFSAATVRCCPESQKLCSAVLYEGE